VREVSAREGGVTAVDRHRELEKTLAPARVGLVHGDMDARTKDATLRAFRAGELAVLVATTVIEVGIDVPEASLMVVEEAERFGFYNRLVEPEKLLEEATALAKSLADGPTFGHAMTKTMLWQEWNSGLGECIEAEAQAQAICMQTADFERAYHAFVAKQKPVFEGN